MIRLQKLTSALTDLCLYTLPFAEHFWVVNHAYKEPYAKESSNMCVYTEGLLISLLKGITATVAYGAFIDEDVINQSATAVFILGYSSSQVAAHIIAHKVYSKNISLEE